MQNQSTTPAAVLIDLPALGELAQGNGPQWSHESSDLDLTLLSWASQREIAAHVNGEVDVVLIVVAGAGNVTVEGAAYHLTAGQALLIPKGTERSIRSTVDRFSYLSLHRCRAGLWPTIRGAS